jgi:hypothetical protein
MQININTVFPFGCEPSFFSQRYLEMLLHCGCIPHVTFVMSQGEFYKDADNQRENEF